MTMSIPTDLMHAIIAIVLILVIVLAVLAVLGMRNMMASIRDMNEDPITPHDELPSHEGHSMLQYTWSYNASPNVKVCSRCRKIIVDNSPADSLCPECRKIKEHNKKKREDVKKYREYFDQRQKENDYWFPPKYSRLKYDGICVRCRVNKAVPGYTRCEACREKERLARSKRKSKS